MIELAAEGRLDALDEARRILLLERRPSDEPELRRRVREILAEVRRDGDEALRRMARLYDDVELEALEVPRARWEEALESLDVQLRSALDRAARNVERFHRAQIPDAVEVETESGVRLGRRSVPLRRAGVYAPGGRASYPSSLLMGVVPAVAAGVEEVFVASPPGPSGAPPSEVLAACAIGGATRLFALGGAGAVAALAYGTESVPRVEVVVGPGNRWVTEAKRQVAGEVRVDAPAGPSEVLVVAEEGSVSADRVAAELVAQAEHDPDAAVAAVCLSGAFLSEVRARLEARVEAAPRREIVADALAERGALLEARSLGEALDFADRYAPEHLALYVAEPRAAMEGVRTAGTVFLGSASSVAHGDYLTGANHVLPTGGLGRTFSGLSTEHFLRSYTWQELTPDAAATLAGPIAALAGAEGLPGHAEAARLRGGGGR